MRTISRLGREGFVIVTGYGVLKTRYNRIHAGIAQLVEQLLRKQLVGGSSPLSGTIQRSLLCYITVNACVSILTAGAIDNPEYIRAPTAPEDQEDRIYYFSRATPMK